MITVSVTPKDYILADLMSSLEIVSTKVMPKTYKAIKMASMLVMYTWKSYAMGAPIPGSALRIKNPTGGYARSIKIRRLTPFSSLVYSDSMIAKYLEDGTNAFDMKKTHPFGKHSRVSKDGVPYLIIPIRHGVPGTLSYAPMPAELYNKIRQEIKAGTIEMSQVAKEKKTSPNYKGELIPRRTYKWGTSITSGVLGMEKTLGNMEGLVVMNVSSAGSKRSQYITFRIISANSPSFKWLRLARPALKLSEHVVNNTKDIISEMIQQGIKEDIGL